jgi:hypothetical protein
VGYEIIIGGFGDSREHKSPLLTCLFAKLHQAVATHF